MRALSWIGRLLLGGFFVYSGVKHFTQFVNMAHYAAYEQVPWPSLAVIAGGVMLLMGGLSTLLGQMRVVGSLLVAAFLLSAAFLVHNFWVEQDPGARANQQAHFLKNIALAGAALATSAFDRRETDATC